MSEERAAAVLRVLEAELPPSTVDIDRAVRAGRRRERTRRVLAAGALAGVTVLATIGVVTVAGGGGSPPPARTGDNAVAAVPEACVATVLPGAADEVTAISPNGRFVVGTTADPAVPLLWIDGTPAPVTVPAGVTATPHAVNDDGVIVGLARRDGRTLPFMVRGGGYTELGLPTGGQGVAHAVNARGQIVGTAFWTNGTTKAVQWEAPGIGTILPSDTQAAAFAIGDDGAVYGTLDDGATPYAWSPDGTGRPLPAIAGSTAGKAMAVAGDYVFGHAGTVDGSIASRKDQQKGQTRGGEPRWVRWQLSTGTVVEVTGMSAVGVDANGAVIGAVRTGDDGFMPARWRDPRIQVLPGPDRRPGTGRVVATSRDGSRLVGTAGTGHVLWRCSNQGS